MTDFYYNIIKTGLYRLFTRHVVLSTSNLADSVIHVHRAFAEGLSRRRSLSAAQLLAFVKYAVLWPMSDNSPQSLCDHCRKFGHNHFSAHSPIHYSAISSPHSTCPARTLIPPSNGPPVNALQLQRLIVFTFRGAEAAGFQFGRSLDRGYGASQKCYIK